MADQFPGDIILGILSRLPIKSLARVRCVCKLWLKYINDPYLETIRVKEEPTPIMLQENGTVCKVSFLRVIQGTSTVKTDSVLTFNYKPWSDWDQLYLILGSCNGLTLVGYEHDPWHGIFLAVINPITKVCDDLPPIKIRRGPIDWYRSREAAGIGFDDSTNTLKTVCVFLKEPVSSRDINVKQLCAMIHYSGMRSWREIARIPAYPISGKGVFARGRLHWLVNHNDGGKIVWFDVKTEEFGLMDGPKPKGDIEHQLVDLNGEVGFAYIGDHIELWISKAEEWVLHCWFDLDLPPYHYAVVSGCWNKEGDVLLSINSYRGEVKRLVVYTLKSGDLREVVGWGDPCEAEIVMYPNSLFPIQGIYKKCLFD